MNCSPGSASEARLAWHAGMAQCGTFLLASLQIGWLPITIFTRMILSGAPGIIWKRSLYCGSVRYGWPEGFGEHRSLESCQFSECQYKSISIRASRKHRNNLCAVYSHGLSDARGTYRY